MSLKPLWKTGCPTYPGWHSRIARALRGTAVVASSALLLGPLGCVSGPPGVMVAPTVENEAQPAPPGGVTEEWIQLPLRILFENNSSELDDMSRAILREAHVSLQRRTDVLRLRVEGYAYLREEPAEGLALARAERVVDYMVGELGMPRDLFETADSGDGDMASDTNVPDQRLARRVEFSMLVRRPR